MTISPLADVPQPQVRYGRVTGHWVSFLADSPDEGTLPDEVPLSGQATLVPRVHVVRWATTVPPRTAVVERLVCPIIEGHLYPPGTTADDLPDEPGVWVVASVQPDGDPTLVQWSASVRLDGASAQPAPTTFEVPDGAEVDLTLVMPVTPEPGVVHVVTSADRIAAQEAAGDAAGYASDAAESATVSEAHATTATTAQADAAASATAAAESAQTAAEAAESVHGFRVFLVPHDEWPPAPDPSELHWYVRARMEDA